MNDSEYGLTASIWTKDEALAIEIADQYALYNHLILMLTDCYFRIDTGTVFMNRCDYLDPALPWTGVKDSGRGATLSKLGFDALTRPKGYHLRVKT